MAMKTWLRNAIVLFLVILITACVSVAVTVTMLNMKTGERVVLSGEEYSAFQALLPVAELMEKIKAEHYGDDITDASLVKGALEGMLKSIGDPYSRYYTEEEYTAYMEQLDGSYHGIGALVGQPQDGGVTVLKVYDKGPASQAGLLPGDIIVAVDGLKIGNLAFEDIEKLFVGADGSNVTVDVMRSNSPLSFSMTRAAGTTQRVAHKLFLQHTGYIRIDKFTGTASEEFREALRDLTDRGMRSLVIDLRNNPGGELGQVVSITDLLLGKADIVTVRAANGKEDIYRSDERHVSVPLAILVNENSASASEILAAAVQDTQRGVIVGSRTYGKGVVQTTMQLNTTRGWVKLTTAAYYTPSGKNVDGTGVQPDVDVDLADDIKALPIDQIEQDDDAQLWAALDIIREQADAGEGAVGIAG